MRTEITRIFTDAIADFKIRGRGVIKQVLPMSAEPQAFMALQAGGDLRLGQSGLGHGGSGQQGIKGMMTCRSDSLCRRGVLRLRLTVLEGAGIITPKTQQFCAVCATSLT